MQFIMILPFETSLCYAYNQPIAPKENIQYLILYVFGTILCLFGMQEDIEKRQPSSDNTTA